MRHVALLALLAAAIAPALAQDAATYVLPTERYGIAWGATPADVVGRFSRPADAEGPGATLTYIGQGGGQAIFVFETDGEGTDRLAVVIDAAPSFADAGVADEEHGRFKAALTRLYGRPAMDESPRPDGSGMVDTVWLPAAGVQAVELTRDAVVRDGEPWPFFYVRVVGPVVDY